MARPRQPLFGLLTFRNGPQDLPYSPSLLGIVLAAFVASGLLALSPVYSVGESLGQIAFEVAFTVAALAGLLALAGHWQRLVQSLTAVWAVGTVIQLLSFPVLRGIYVDGEPDPSGAGGGLLLLALLIWNLALISHILRHALGVSQLQAVAVTLAYYLLLVFLLTALFPAAESA